MLNITNKNWGEESEISVFVLFDPYIYNKDLSLFNDYYMGNIYCDSLGELYKIIDKSEPTQLWRKLLRSLPNVYKIELQLQKLNKRMELEDLRQFMLDRINELELTDFDRKWIKHVEQAPNHYEIIGGEVK